MNNRTIVLVYRIAGTLFAFAAGVNVVGAYRAHQRAEAMGFAIAMAVTYFALCVVFMALARMKAGKSN